MPGPDLSFIPSELPASTGNGGLDAYTKAGLGALKGAPTSDILSSDAFKQIQQMLGAGADGGLSPALMAMFKSGQRMNSLGTSANVASAKSDAVGRGLEGSTVESQGVESAKFAGSMADSSLMSGLFDKQNSNNNSLASLLFQGQSMNDAQGMQRLQMLLQLLSSAGDDSANISMFNTGLSAEKDAAAAASKSAMWGALLQGGGAAAGGFLGGL